jgi:hypothetical protein
MKTLINIERRGMVAIRRMWVSEKNKFTWDRVTSDMLFFNMIKTERKN